MVPPSPDVAPPTDTHPETVVEAVGATVAAVLLVMVVEEAWDYVCVWRGAVYMHV